MGRGHGLNLYKGQNPITDLAEFPTARFNTANKNKTVEKVFFIIKLQRQTDSTVLI